MGEAVFVTFAAGGFVAALLHAALPTHWLPFVLVGRAQGWSGRKTLAVTALAGGGHILSTVILAVVLMTAGLALEERFGLVLTRIAGLVLIGFGLLYLFSRSPPVVEGRVQPRRRVSDLAAILGLVGVLVLSPGETFASVLLAGLPYGWGGFVVLSVVLATATLGGMLLFTGASWAGAARLRLDVIERYERLLLGGALCVLGVLILVLRH